MEETNIDTFYLFIQNETNTSHFSSFYPEINSQNPQNDTTEIGSTGINQNTEQNNGKLENFIEKKNFQNKSFEAFNIHGMYSSKHIDGVELAKNYDYYYLETKINESRKNENNIFSLTQSKNYVPKQVFTQGNLIGSYTMQPFLYYKIKLDDTLYCTYIDEYYGFHRVVHKISPEANNNTT